MEHSSFTAFLKNFSGARRAPEALRRSLMLTRSVGRVSRPVDLLTRSSVALSRRHYKVSDRHIRQAPASSVQLGSAADGSLVLGELHARSCLAVLRLSWRRAASPTRIASSPTCTMISHPTSRLPRNGCAAAATAAPLLPVLYCSATFGDPMSLSLTFWLLAGRLAQDQGARAPRAGADHHRHEGVGPAWPRWRWLPFRPQVVVHAQEQHGDAAVPGGQRG